MLNISYNLFSLEFPLFVKGKNNYVWCIFLEKYLYNCLIFSIFAKKISHHITSHHITHILKINIKKIFLML